MSVAVTLAYHLPANYRIWLNDLTADEVSTELDRWLAFHALRTIVSLVAVVWSYRAITASLAATREA